MKINRSNIIIYPNVKKVIINYLTLGTSPISKRIGKLISRVLALDEEEVECAYQEIEKEFAHRHLKFDYFIAAHFERIQKAIPEGIVLSESRKKLLGVCFTKEYSIQSAALFNPSMVAHPDQSGLTDGEKRFIISLRSVGEGHISSIEFRAGVVDAAGNIALAEDTGFATCTVPDESKFFHAIRLKRRTSMLPDFDQAILNEWGETFTKKDYLNTSPDVFAKYDKNTQSVLASILDTNYDTVAHTDSALSERILFPMAQQESNGMEDVRFVKFMENGKPTFIGTYTAYDGHRISPQLVITEDFMRFKIRTMYGAAVNDKGFALFPEKINGQFVMVGRQGGEDITIMYSDDLFTWENYESIMTPEKTWGLIQMGNCGSPIKTEEGWLVMTHAVGPMRKYVISAILLDLKKPSKIIKKLDGPLLFADEAEREGYVPNVVYSCGWMRHRDLLVIPYALSDSACTFATVDVGELLRSMVVC